MISLGCALIYKMLEEEMELLIRISYINQLWTTPDNMKRLPRNDPYHAPIRLLMPSRNNPMFYKH